MLQACDRCHVWVCWCVFLKTNERGSTVDFEGEDLAGGKRCRAGLVAGGFCVTWLAYCTCTAVRGWASLFVVSRTTAPGRTGVPCNHPHGLVLPDCQLVYKLVRVSKCVIISDCMWGGGGRRVSAVAANRLRARNSIVVDDALTISAALECWCSCQQPHLHTLHCTAPL